MASGETQTSVEYIRHHLTNLTYGQYPDGTWGFAHSAEEAQAMGFWSIHVDSMAWSIGLGLVFLFFFRRAAKRATAGVPGGLQNFVEIIVEFIDDTTMSIFSHKNDFVAPLALTIFVWVFLMNLMDPGAGGLGAHAGGIARCALHENRAEHGPQHHHGHGAVGVRTDPVLQHQVQGRRRLPGGTITAPVSLESWPFPSIKFVLEMVTLIAKPLSLGLRLFGNLYAGEMIFVLIALMFTGGIVYAVAGGVFQWVWAAFHLIVITLQAFVFSVLTVVYLAQAHDTDEH